LIALGDLGEPRALPAAREGLDSRSEEIVIASARSAGSLIKKSGHAVAEFRDALATLLADSSATEPMRAAALEALILIEDPRIDTALAAAVADAGLEGTSLQGRVEELMRERKVRLVARSRAIT
jgi:HEAT repeat protein